MTVRRLIEEELPLQEVNTASAREKSLRHGHISTMHLWWARRPLAMSRAVVFGTLLPDPGDEGARKEALDAIAAASEFEASADPKKIGPLREMLAAAYPDEPPRVLDCFAGGGAIPLEALRLGCDTTAVDLNPVAHLLQKAALEFPQRFGQPDPESGRNHLVEDFEYWAQWLRQDVAADLDTVFPSDPAGDRPAVYFWCRTMVCSDPACGLEIPLLKSKTLANSSRRKAWIAFSIQAQQVGITVTAGDSIPPEASTGTIRASSATCPACGNSFTATQVRDYGKSTGFGSRLFAVCDIKGRSRTYREPTPAEVDGALNTATTMLAAMNDLDDGTTAVPDEICDPNGFRRVQGIPFGIMNFADMFNHRQLFVLARMALGVRRAHAEMLVKGLDPEYAAAVATYLGFLVDRIADYDCTFTVWVPSGEFHSHVFSRQAVAMTWDFVEIDPFGTVSGSYDGAIKWIKLALQHCCNVGREPAAVSQGNAQALPFEDGHFDAVITDPPYYDAIQYSYLSDFFYVWLKRSVGHLYPGQFATTATPKRQEVVQNQAKRTSPDYVSPEEFDRRLEAALGEMVRVLKPDGILALVFAHTDVQAWEKLLRALRSAGAVVTTSWPMRSERGARMTANIQHAVLGSSVVLVCRKQAAIGEGYFDDVIRELDERITERLDRFESMGLMGADYFASAVGPAFEVFAKYARVIRLSGDEVDVPELMTLARQVVARRAMGKLLGDDAVGVLDPVSLMYLTWRWAYDGEGIPADEAYKLERALDVDLSELSGHNGLARRTGSNMALLGPEDRRGLKPGPGAPMIDVLHAACVHWDAGRRQELEELLGTTGMGNMPSFWALARALAEVLPEGNRERTMLLGLTGNRDNLAAASDKHTSSRPEQRAFNLEGE